MAMGSRSKVRNVVVREVRVVGLEQRPDAGHPGRQPDVVLPEDSEEVVDRVRGGHTLTPARERWPRAGTAGPALRGNDPEVRSPGL
jgi:hypothetical protein